MYRRRLAPGLLSLVTLWLLGAGTAHAASLQKIEQGTWSTGGLPGYVNMYLYVPDKLASKPPVLVASHHCGGSATSTFNETRSTFVSLADKNGFLIIFPEATGHNCWDVGSAKSLKHDGGGDTQAIAQMVRYVLSKHAADASRVYAFGTSSGAMMTQALLGVYPDMFVAGVAVSGVACGCWAEQYTGDSGANPQWSGPCAGGNVSKTAQQWGDLVRGTFPGYTGHRPRVQLWHGTADTTINFKNLGESVKEWTDVLGLDAQAAASDSARAGYMHQAWKSACGYVVLETWAQQGAGHNVSWDAASAAGFLGLDAAGTQDPETIACPQSGGQAGSSGASGAGGAGGAPPAAAAGSGAANAAVGGVPARVAAAGSGAPPTAAAAGGAPAGGTNAAAGNGSAARPAGPAGVAGSAPGSQSSAASAGQRATQPVGTAGHTGEAVGAPGAVSEGSGGCSAAGGRGAFGRDLAWLGALLGMLVRRRHMRVRRG